MKFMKFDPIFVYDTMRVMYVTWIREILKAAVDDPKKSWDDYLMMWTDRLFGYEEPATIEELREAMKSKQ